MNKDNNNFPIARKCSFNPADYFIQIDSLRGDGAKQNYLEVKFRVLWFNIFCEENGVMGVIDDSDVTVYENAGVVKATCSIFMDGKLVAKASGGQALSGDKGNTLIQTVTTIAKGRALANAGFGTAMGAAEDGETIPCDAGIPAQNTAPAQNEAYARQPMNPMMTHNNPYMPYYQPQYASQQPSQYSTNPVQNAIQQPLEKAPDNAKALPTTLEEAQRIVVDSGKYKGKTLGEIAALDIEFIRFYAEKYNFKKHPDYKEGARIILANM